MAAQDDPKSAPHQVLTGTPAEGMELDPRYLAIREEVAQKWLQNNPGKNLLSYEGQNYQLGSLDSEERHSPTLRTDTEKLFRERHGEDARAYDLKEKTRIYNDPKEDPAIAQVNEAILRDTNTNSQVRNFNNSAGTDTYEHEWRRANISAARRNWEEFLRQYPEKAKAYADAGHDELKSVFEERERAQKYEEQQELRRQAEAARPKTLADDATYRSFMNNSATGLNARVWDSASRSESLTFHQYNEKAKVVKEQMHQEFAAQYPDIWTKYNGHPKSSISESVNSNSPSSKTVITTSQIPHRDSPIIINRTAKPFVPKTPTPSTFPPPPTVLGKKPFRKMAGNIGKSIGLLAAGAILGSKAVIIAGTKQKSTYKNESATGHKNTKDTGGEDPVYQGYVRWKYVLLEFPDIAKLLKYEEFIIWIEQHPDALHPYWERLFISSDWNDRAYYYQYLSRMPEDNPANEKKNETTTHHAEEHDYIFGAVIVPEAISPKFGIRQVLTSFRGGVSNIMPIGGSGGGGGAGSSQGNQGLDNDPRRRMQNLASKLQKLQKYAQWAQRAGKAIAFIAEYWWLILIFVLLALLFIFAMQDQQDAEKNGTATVSISKSVDKTQINNPPSTPGTESQLTYTLNVQYTGTAQGINITDHIPDNVDFLSADGPGNPTFDSSTRTVSWNIALGGGGTGDGTGPTGYVPPSDSNCNGAYPYIGGSYPSNDPQLPPPYKNFGDPVCDFTKDKLYTLLKEKDPANADFWFNKVVPCESAYDPNNVTYWVGSVHTPDPYGAWGLFQQGSDKSGTPFINFNEGSYNNPTRPEDRGDTNWQNQTINAVLYGQKYLTPQGIWLGAYWACAQ